jgi:hypothetical protein
MILIDDFVMLGKTVPEEDSQGRVTVCSAGFSPQLRGLLRLYPLARYEAPGRWTMSTVRLERNIKDQRAESWKLHGERDRAHHDYINRTAFENIGPAIAPDRRPEMLRPFVIDWVDRNEILDRHGRHISLALVEPHEMQLEFEFNPGSPDSPQMALFDTWEEKTTGAKRFPWIPRIRFDDSQGRQPPMLRDWGVYERMRKEVDFAVWPESERRRHLVEALHLDPTCSLLIGNFNRHRTEWLIISVLRGVRIAQPSLLDELADAA